MRADSSEHSLTAMLKTLIAKGTLSPLELGGEEESLWMCCDLTSFAENRLGDRRDPWSLGDQTRRNWSHKVLDYPLRLPSESKWVSSFWIEREGAKAGTLALAKMPLAGMVDRYSVYLRQTHRGRGLMADGLRALQAELEH